MMNEVDELSQSERMIRQQIIDRGIRDPRVVEAMRAVPREKFFPQADRDEAYADRASSIGHGQTISQPYMVALMTQRLDVQPGHKVLEIGTGSGYQTAILSQLGGEVYSVERVKPLLDTAWERLMEMNLRNVHFRWGDGSLGWPEAGPFDRIIITAGAPKLPRELLLNQLADGGIAVLPIGDQNEQMLLGVVRQGNRLDTAEICACRFVKLVGAQGWDEA